MRTLTQMITRHTVTIATKKQESESFSVTKGARVCQTSKKIILFNALTTRPIRAKRSTVRGWRMGWRSIWHSLPISSSLTTRADSAGGIAGQVAF